MGTGASTGACWDSGQGDRASGASGSELGFLVSNKISIVILSNLLFLTIDFYYYENKQIVLAKPLIKLTLHNKHTFSKN